VEIADFHGTLVAQMGAKNGGYPQQSANVRLRVETNKQLIHL
jgi:hypothetical protein